MEKVDIGEITREENVRYVGETKRYRNMLEKIIDQKKRRRKVKMKWKEY